MNYPTVPLKELLVLHDAGVWGPENCDNGISVLRSTNFEADGSIRFENLSFRYIEPRKRQTKTLAPNDILLEKSGGGPKQPVGRVCLYRGHHLKHVFGNFTARLRANNDIAEPQYLFWCLRHLYMAGATEQYQRHTSGIRNLETKRYLAHPIPLPPLDEQRRIVGVLNRAANIERLRAQAAERLREFILALFIKMFGDPVENPMGWQTEKLGSLGTLDRGRSRHRPRNAPELYGGPYPFVQTGDIANSDGMVKEYSQTYSECGLNQSKKWPCGTLCITIAANIGMTATLDFDACFPDSVVGFSPGENVAISYIQTAIDLMQNKLEEDAPKAAQRNINLKILKELIVPVPPLEMQSQYAQTVETARSTIAVAESGSRTASELSAALMSRVLETGA